MIVAICLVIAAVMWGAATAIVYQGNSPTAPSGAAWMLVFGAGLAFVLGVLIAAVDDD